jgi:hypothetical protein
MKLILYAGSRLVTGDEISTAVLDYCAALADADTAETVEIPVLTAEGVRSHATLLVGPSSQIVAEDVTTAFEELVDPDVVSLLRQKTRMHRPVASNSPHPAEDADARSWSEEY